MNWFRKTAPTGTVKVPVGVEVTFYITGAGTRRILVVTDAPFDATVGAEVRGHVTEVVKEVVDR